MLHLHLKNCIIRGDASVKTPMLLADDFIEGFFYMNEEMFWHISPPHYLLEGRDEEALELDEALLRVPVLPCS